MLKQSPTFLLAGSARHHFGIKTLTAQPFKVQDDSLYLKLGIDF